MLRMFRFVNLIWNSEIPDLVRDGASRVLWFHVRFNPRNVKFDHILISLPGYVLVNYLLVKLLTSLFAIFVDITEPPLLLY
jgi:hypothetical protein